MTIRPSTDSDRDAISDVHTSAFGSEEGPVIVQLVHDLFDDSTAEPLLSLVAADEEQVVGHVLFTNVTIEPNGRAISAQILAPLAVKPGSQKHGIGSALIKNGLQRLTDSGTELVFVLGDPAYYSRFGFQTAAPYKLVAPHPIPEKFADAWMVQSLRSDILDGVKGTVRCADSLNDPKHWIEPEEG